MGAVNDCVVNGKEKKKKKFYPNPSRISPRCRKQQSRSAECLLRSIDFQLEAPHFGRPGSERSLQKSLLSQLPGDLWYVPKLGDANG